jgi:hypothetical protein
MSAIGPHKDIKSLSFVLLGGSRTRRDASPRSSPESKAAKKWWTRITDLYIGRVEVGPLVVYQSIRDGLPPSKPPAIVETKSLTALDHWVATRNQGACDKCELWATEER